MPPCLRSNASVLLAEISGFPLKLSDLMNNVVCVKVQVKFNRQKSLKLKIELKSAVRWHTHSMNFSQCTFSVGVDSFRPQL